VRLDDLEEPSHFTGLAARQTERFLREEVEGALDPFRDRLGSPSPEIRV
jgi:hypothetical protein